MFAKLLQVFGLQPEEPPPSIFWWGYQPPPKSRFVVFYDAMSDIISTLWRANVEAATWQSTGVAMAICILVVYLVWSLRRRERSSGQPQSEDQQSLCSECRACKERMKNERHLKPGMNESSEDSLEQDISCMKKEQHNATQVSDKLMFEETEGARNESKAASESSFDCCEKTSAHSFGTVTSENLSFMENRSISYNTSLHNALKSEGKGCQASSDSNQDLLGMYTSVGTNTSDQFSSGEIWRTSPSVAWTNTEEQYITNKYLDNKRSDTSRHSTTWKETKYSSRDSEKYLVSSLDFPKDEMTKSSLSENAKKAVSQLSTPESSFSYNTQTSKTSDGTALSMQKIPCVNAKKLECLSTPQTPVCSQLTPVSAPVGFDTISYCSSDGCSSFAHYSDAQLSSASPWPASTSSNTATRNTCFSVTEIETSECMSSPSSPMPAQNFANNSYYSGFQEKGLPDSEMKQTESLAFSKSKNQLPLSDAYHLEEKYAKVKSTNLHRHPVVQEIASLTQENVEKFELFQQRKYVQSVLPFVAEKLETSKKSQGIMDKDWQRENMAYQTIPSVIPRLHENQIGKLEQNVAQMALESQGGLPFIHRKSLSTMMLPLSPLPKQSAKPTVRELKPPIPTLSEGYDLEFGPQRRIGMHQWRPTSVDSAVVNIVRSEVPTFNERQATCLKLNLGKYATRSQRAAEIQKSPEAPLEDDSVALVEIKAEDAEKSPVYHNQEIHFKVKPITNATEDKVENVNKPDALQQQPVSAHQSSKIDAELMNESVVQEIDMANENIEIIQLTKAENMQQLNSGELQTKMETFTKKKFISETIESKESLSVQPDVASKANEKEKNYQAIARQGLMTPTPLSILAANTISDFQEYPTNFEESARVITPQGTSLTIAKDVQIEPTSVESALFDEKMRNCLEWHITQKKLQYNGDVSSNFERPTEVLISPSPKWIPSQQIDPAFIPNELPFITVEHKIIEENVKKKIAGNKSFIKLSLDDMVHAPLQSEKDLKGREKIFPSHDGGIRNGERNKLKELSVTTFKNQLNICLTKQCLEMKIDRLPDMVMESYEKFYGPAPKKHLPKLITVGKGYKKPRPLYIPFMECNAVDHIEMNLKQKLISSLWGSPSLFEKSLETMIPKAPPVPPPIKARVAKIEPIGRETNFIEEKTRNHLERHITQRKLELKHNWALPTEVQRSRASFMPPGPKLIHSQPKSQYYADLVTVLTEPSFISNEHKKTEDNIKEIINHKCGHLPNVDQMSSMNFVNSYSMKDATAPSAIIKERKMLTGNLDCYKKTIHHTQTSLLLEHGDNGKGTKVNEVVKDKLDMCIRKHCLEIKLNYLPEIVKEMYKVTYSSESKSGLPKLIAPGRGYKKSRPHYIPFIEQDLIYRVELNLKHKQISHLWRVETLYKKSLELMICHEQFLLPAKKTMVTKVESIAVETHFISNHTRSLLEWHIIQKKLQDNWGVPLLILRSQQAFIPPAPKLIESQLKPRPDFDVNIIPIKPAFLCAETKKKLELNVKKKIINQRWGLPKFVRLSLESFIPRAPSVTSVKPQSGIGENESQVNGKFKTVSLPSTLLQLKGGKLTTPQCEQAIKSVKSSEKRTLPVLAGLKLEHKDKLDMCLIKQCLDIKMNHLPSIVQKFYKNTYPSEQKKTLSKFLRAGEGLKKRRPSCILFFEHDAIDKLEMNLKHKHLSHLLGFQTLYEESMEIMIPKAPPVLPAIKASRSQIETVSMETTFLGGDVRANLEWHIIQKKLQLNWGLPFYYQKSMEAFIPAAPKLVPSWLKPHVDVHVIITPWELSFVSVEISKKLELNIKKKLINQRWGLPKCIQSSLREFMALAPPVNVEKTSKAVARKKNNNIGIRETCKTGNPQKASMQPNGKKLTSAQCKREKRKSETKSGEEFILSYLKQEDKDKLDICLMKQRLEIHMNTLPEMVTNFYKITYPPNPKRSFPRLIVPRNGFRKPRASYISFIEQGIVDRLELNLKHKQINHLWGVATPYVESLGMMICSGPPIPPTIKASGAQIEPVSRESNFSAEVVKDLNMHVIRKKLQQNWGLPLLIQQSQNAFIPPAPKLILSKLKPQPDFVIVFSPPELTFLHEEHKRRLEFSVKKKIVNSKWGLPKVVLSSMRNFMPPAPSVEDLIPQRAIIKNKKVVGNTCIKKKSEVHPQDTFPVHIQRKILLPQTERGSNNKKLSNKIVGFSGLKPEHKDKLDVCVTKQSLEIKMHCIPKLVTEFYKHTYATPPKKVLPRLIASGEGSKKPRSMYIPFIEQDAVYHLELNLKHKQIINLWALETEYEMSVKMMIPEGPNAQPLIISKGVKIEPVGMETAFIDVEARNELEWHITRKKLENNWGLPLHIQKSIDNHIPPAPKLVPCQLKQHCFYDTVVVSADPDFLSSEHRKRLELNIKKKIINQKWGLPKLIQLSRKLFMPSPPSLQDRIPNSKVMKGVKTFPNANVEFNLKMVRRQEKGKLLSPIHEKVPKKANTKKISAFPEFATLEKEYKHKLNTCLLMQVLNTKMHFLPDIVQKYYKNSYPAISKKPLSKPISVGEGFKKQRPWYLPFVEQGAVERLELNLKHKQMMHLWKCETLYDKSMEMMIPEGPPVPPAIKASGAKIEPVGMETSFIEYDIRDALEWHITQKKLQQNWGFPLHVQISAELFIPPAPKLIPSQLNPKPCFGVIVISNELEFLSEEHRKLLELNAKKKIINHRWGLPTLIQSSLEIFMGLDGLRNDRMLTMASNAGLSNTNVQSKVGIPSQMKKVGTLPLQCKKDSKNTNPSKTRVPDIFAIHKQENIDKLDMCIRKLHLEIELHCLPEMVKQYYKESYPSKSKKLLKKSIVPGEGCKKPRSLYIAFIEQDAVDRLDWNLKHKLILSLWGLATPYEKSTEMVFPKGPPVPPAIKSSGVKIEPTGMETPFIADNVRENLERCVIRKKLQNTWGLPLYVQRSEEAFIPIAPKLILSQLKPQPAFSFITVPNELAFLHADHKKVLEINIKKKIINSKWGLPKLIQSSLNSFTAASSDLCSLTNTCNNESEMSPPHTFPKVECGKLTTLQDKTCDRSKKTENIDENLVCTSLNPDWKHVLETCVIKLCLDIKTGYFPEMVTKFYENTYPSQPKKPLPKLIVFGRGFKKRRPCYLPFIEQNALDRLELNLKHKNIIHLWKVPTLYDESKEIMIPKGPPVPPAIKGSGALIHPVQLEISFIEDEVKAELEWHITRKKLQLSFGLPLFIQKSQEAFIPAAPKLIPSQLKAQLDFIYVFVSSELFFLSSEQRRGLELITRKRIIHYKWGLPKAVQHSLNNFMPSLSLQSEMMERNEQAKNKREYVPMSTCLQPKSAKVSSKQNQESGGVLKPNNMAERGLSAKLQPECKDKLESCLIKQCLDIKFCVLPDIVYKMYEAAFPPISKKPLPKKIEPGKGFKKSRSSYIPFIEQDAVDCLDLNLKQKHIMHLWGITTLFEESVALMIPKPPPDPPGIKASGAQIEHVGMETTFIDCEIRERLEWHILQKKLQLNWGLPLHIQISQEAFIPPAPKLIASQLKPRLNFAVVIVPAELNFLPDGHQKVLELNMKKRIINSKWGLPESVQLSNKLFIPFAPQMKDVIIQPQRLPLSPRITPSASRLRWMKRLKLLLPTIQENVEEEENHEASSANVICRDVIDLCLIKQCLEIKMGHLPNLVKDAYRVTYNQGLKKTLTKMILPGQGVKKQRASYMPFIEQKTIDRLELNLKHKQIINLWGLLSLHEESLEMMIPKAPPLPPIIKARGNQIEPVGMEMIFIGSETRESLEWHITRKKLQYNWGLPTHIQSSLDAFIPLAPKLILSQLSSKPNFTVVVVPSEIEFLSDEVKHILERNIKKKIINRKWGLPKVISSSLIQFMPPIPVDKSFILPAKDANESNITCDNLGKSCEIFSQSTNLQLKGGKLIPQCGKVDMTMQLHLSPECIHNLNISLTKQCLETKMDCIPKLVKDLYKITYPLVSKKQLPKIIVPGTGFKRTRTNYIPFVEQDAVHRIEMNLKHRQILCLWGLKTLYEESMEIMIPKGPPMPPLVKTGRAGIKPVGEATSSFSDEVTKLLEWHILRKKLQHTWGSPSYFQKSVESFIPPAPKLVVTQLNPQPNFKIEIAPVELTFINDEHKKALEMNTKKRIINHRWGLPKVIESSLNEFMAPPPQIKDLVAQLEIEEECGSEGLSKNYEAASAQCASHLSKVEKSTLDCEWFKESVRMKTRETSVNVKLSPESENKLNMCLMKQNLSNKLDCVPDLVTEMYQQTYFLVLKKPLAKLITAGKGFKRPRSSYILFAEQDVINCLETNLKYKQLNNLSGTATPYDMSMEEMIPEGPPLFPAIKPTRAKIEHVGMGLTFQSAETIDILEWHIETKKSQHHLGVPLHIQRSIDTSIPPPPKLVLSQFNPYPNFDIALSANDQTFVNEELQETLETNTNSQIINHSGGPHTSLNNSILPASPIKKDMQLARTSERNTADLKRCQLSRTDIVSTDQKSMTRTNCREFDESSNDNYMEEPCACPNLESKDKEDGGVAEQCLEMQPLDKCIYSDTSKHFLNPNTPCTKSKEQNKTKQKKKKQKSKCYADYLDVDSIFKTSDSSTWISDQELADLTYKLITSERLSLSPAIIGENLTSSPLTVQKDLNFYLKQNTDSVTLPPPGPYVDCEEMLSKNASDIGNDEFCSEQLTEEAKIHIQQAEKHAYDKIITSALKNQNEEENMQVDLTEMICSQPPPAVKPKTKFSRQGCRTPRTFKHEEGRSSDLGSQSTLFVGPSEELQNTGIVTCGPDTDEKLLDKCIYSDASNHFLNPDTPCTKSKTQKKRKEKKKQRKSKCYADYLDVDSIFKTSDSSTWISDQELADLTYNPMTSERLSLSPAIIGENLTSSPLTVQKDLNFYLKQNTDSVTLPPPGPYVDCEEMLSKNASDIGNDEFCSEQLTEEAKIHIQQAEEHAYDKIITSALKNQNEEENMQVDLTEMNCSQPPPAVKPKTKFSRQGCRTPRTFKHEEGRSSDLGNQSTLFVGPSEELQNTGIMTCGPDTDEKPLDKCIYSDASNRFLNPDTPCTKSKTQKKRKEKKQRKSKCYADYLDVDSIFKTSDSSTWMSDQELTDLTYNPMTSERLSLSPAIIGENLTSSPLTVWKDLNFHLKQNTDSVTLPPPSPSEVRRSELGNQSTLFVGPSEELQNTGIMTCGSDTNEKEKSLTQETSENHKDNKQSLQSSTSHSLGCQQVLPNEDTPFATNEDSEVHYQCESPFLTHTVH